MSSSFSLAFVAVARSSGRLHQDGLSISPLTPVMALACLLVHRLGSGQLRAVDWRAGQCSQGRLRAGPAGRGPARLPVERARAAALGGDLASPAHPPGGRIGVITELLRHTPGAALRAEPLQGGPDGRGDHAGGRGVRWLQHGRQQRRAPRVAPARLSQRQLCPGLPVADAPCLAGGRSTVEPAGPERVSGIGHAGMMTWPAMPCP